MPTKAPENKEIPRTAKKRAIHASRTRELPSRRDFPKQRFGSHNRFPLIPGVILIVVTVVLYGSVGSHPFIHYDDQQYVYENVHVKNGLSWDTLTWALTATEASNWHPVTWLSHALDCQLFGLDPAGPHWVNVIIHAVNALLLFWLLWRVTGATWKSLLVAALFALHPLNVESVAWIAERKNVLSTFFFLFALGAYGYYAKKPDLRRYLLVAMLFSVGLAAKPMVITLPFVLLLLDFWPLQRIEGWSEPSATFPVPQTNLPRLVLEKLPLLALSFGSAIITLSAQTDAEVPSEALPFGMRLLTSIYAYGTYLWKAIWPAHLALIYPHPGRTLPVWRTSISALLIAAALWFAWRQRSKRPYLAVGCLWFIGTAVPIIGIVQVGVQVAADRYAYLTLIGIFVAFVWGVSDFADRWSIGVAPRAIVTAVVLFVFTAMTLRQISYWQSTVDLWTHALQVTENNSMAEDFLANELLALGRYQEGMQHLRNFARMEPLDPSSHARVGADYLDHGDISNAIREFETSIRASSALAAFNRKLFAPDQVALTYANLAVCYAQLGDNMKAHENATDALKTDSDAVNQMVSTLKLYLQQRPSATGYLRLATLLREFGHQAEADQAFSRARQLDLAVAAP